MVVNELVEQGPVKYAFIEPPSQPAPGMPKLYTAEATLMVTIQRFREIYIYVDEHCFRAKHSPALVPPM